MYDEEDKVPQVTRDDGAQLFQVARARRAQRGRSSARADSERDE